MSSIIPIGKDATVTVLQSTTVFGPTAEHPTPTLTYPRIIKLAHNQEKNGTLLVTAESLDLPVYQLHRSYDNGNTWKTVGEVSSHLEGKVANWQPMLYELPCKVGALQEGTILLAGCIRNPKTTETAMCIYQSNDLGESWSYLSTVAEGGGFSPTGGLSTGLWEPFLLCDEKGTLYCFYSDEVDAVHHSQMIVYRKSCDGVHWSDTQRIVACSEQYLRPGMASVTRMGDGRYFLTYEMVGINGNPIYYKTTYDLDDWGDPAEMGTIVETPKGERVGCTPFCCFVPSGGRQGVLIVTGMNPAGTMQSATGTDWLVSLDYGASWCAVSNPLPYAQAPHFRYAYSPGLFADPDGKTLYYVNNINSEEVPTKAKIQLAILRID